ncbi:MAG TPA: SGNH/GDSL hydrolase family protein [Puia sp.]|nr:SGNH/GDSL hydrolase family protein [Puia sp.]
MIKILPLLFAALFSFSASAQPPGPGVHKILFLGNSITYAGTYISDIEAYYLTRHPGDTIEFIDLGLPSETVSGLSEPGHADGKFPRPDLHERLHRILEKLRPELIFACYGMNDGIYLPFDQDRFQRYKDGMRWLHDTLVAATGARVILITPPVYDELRGGKAGYSAVLDKYADWLLHQRKTGWEVVDIHFPMKRYLEAHRKVDAAFGIDGFALTSDGIHPGDVGHWLMARQLLLYLGEKDVIHYNSIRQAMSPVPNGYKILQLVEERQGFMKDAWLTATGHKRPGMNTGMPLGEAKAKAAEIEGQLQVLLK